MLTCNMNSKLFFFKIVLKSKYLYIWTLRENIHKFEITLK